jgi:REP element-mobilizing transposase RayT
MVMTAARQILAGTTYLVTRRCSERRFFLRPSKGTNDTFAYLLAVAANRYEIRVHAYCVLSNHFHLVVTDPYARLPDFHRFLDGLVARAINSALGRWESFWDPDSYSAVRLETAEAVLEKMVYVLANPVTAGLVRRARDWPGLWSDPSLLGAVAIPVMRPREFFREDGLMPASARIQLERPPGFESDKSFAETLTAALRSAEGQATARRAGEGQPWLGIARVLAQNPHARPTSFEPRRNLSPRVAARNRWKRIEALNRLAEFRVAYREALSAWRAGVRDVLFPAGTWQMRVHHAVVCSGYS